MEDLKKSLTETIVSYVLIFGILLLDFVINLLKASGIPVFLHEKGLHPVSIGSTQIIMIMLTLVMMLARRLNERRYV
jgi:hypothetical protein